MFSSSLANWDDSQTARERQEALRTTRTSELGNAALVASMAPVIASPAGINTHEAYLVNSNASFHQFEHGGRSRDQVDGSSGSKGTNEVRTPTSQSIYRVMTINLAAYSE